MSAAEALSTMQAPLSLEEAERYAGLVLDFSSPCLAGDLVRRVLESEPFAAPDRLDRSRARARVLESRAHFHPRTPGAPRSTPWLGLTRLRDWPR